MEILEVSAQDFEKNKASAADIFNILADVFAVCDLSKLNRFCSKLKLTTHRMKCLKNS